MFYERIIELIVILLRELKNKSEFTMKEVEKIYKLGYTQNEVSTAFSLIYTKFNQGDKIFSEKNNAVQSHRFLHEVEKKVITPEAFGYLIQLRELGIVNDIDIEVIIDKIMVSGYPSVNEYEMKMFLASHLIDFDEMENTTKRVTININDTIN